MSTGYVSSCSSDGCPPAEALARFHHCLQERAQELLIVLEHPASRWEIRDDDWGYTVRLGSGRLTAEERAAMCAQLRTDLQCLRDIGLRLEALRAAGVVSR